MTPKGPSLWKRFSREDMTKNKSKAFRIWATTHENKFAECLQFARMALDLALQRIQARTPTQKKQSRLQIATNDVSA